MEFFKFENFLAFPTKTMSANHFSLIIFLLVEILKMGKTTAPVSQQNPPHTPRKECKKKNYELRWWDQKDLRTTFAKEMRREERKEAERRRNDRRRREVEERLQWLRQDATRQQF